MLKIEAERIELIPLTGKQLDLWLENVAAFEKEIGCVYRGEPVEGPFVDFIRSRAELVQSDPANFAFHTLWFIVRKSDQTAMGELAFYGTPNDDGAIEIGYGLSPAFQGMGYMTEAVHALCTWALAQPEVTAVLAETTNNPKSAETLKRAGFSEFGRREDAIIWQMKR